MKEGSVEASAEVVPGSPVTPRRRLRRSVDPVRAAREAAARADEADARAERDFRQSLMEFHDRAERALDECQPDPVSYTDMALATKRTVQITEVNEEVEEEEGKAETKGQLLTSPHKSSDRPPMQRMRKMKAEVRSKE